MQIARGNPAMPWPGRQAEQRSDRPRDERAGWSGRVKARKPEQCACERAAVRNSGHPVGDSPFTSHHLIHDALTVRAHDKSARADIGLDLARWAIPNTVSLWPVTKFLTSNLAQSSV
jgi:hypothetical protein